jgi:diacylglycerol kinase (ATP)
VATRRVRVILGAMRVAVLVNPAAGSGSAARRTPEVLRLFRDAGVEAELFETGGPGDAARVVRASADAGFDCVAVMGGDGTFNEACQAFIDERGEARPGPALGLIPSGTGGDFRKTFDLGTSTAEAVDRIVRSPPRRVDLGLLEVTSHDGAARRLAFINIMSFGLGGLTDRIVEAGPKWIGGKGAFYLGAVRGLLAYRNAPVRVRVDGNVFVESPVVNVAVANGRYFGGGMKVAPGADPSDGRFDVVAIGDLTRVQTLGLTSHIYQGTHLDRPNVSHTRGSVVEAESLVPNGEVLVDMDGETPGRLPLRARVAAAAVELRV